MYCFSCCRGRQEIVEGLFLRDESWAWRVKTLTTTTILLYISAHLAWGVKIDGKCEKNRLFRYLLVRIVNLTDRKYCQTIETFKNSVQNIVKHFKFLRAKKMRCGKVWLAYVDFLWFISFPSACFLRALELKFPENPLRLFYQHIQVLKIETDEFSANLIVYPVELSSFFIFNYSLHSMSRSLDWFFEFAFWENDL